MLRNLFINHPSHAFCSQPVLGGPVYWIRNIGYNLPGGSSRFFGAAGVMFYNNTILSETTGTTSNTHWRNNLILGQNGAPDFRRLRPNLFGITTFTNYTSSDYNGFGSRRRTPRCRFAGRVRRSTWPPTSGPRITSRRSSCASSRRSRNTVRRPGRTGTASRWDTTCS